MRLAATLLSTIALFRACQGLRPAVSRRTSRTALRSTMASFSAMATDADVEGASERDGVVANLAAVKGRVAAAAASKPAKRRKVVDRRASKGRKLRYHVQQKLVNFCAPVELEVPQWAEKIFGQLFASSA